MKGSDPFLLYFNTPDKPSTKKSLISHMPSIKNITPLQAGSYYHIFNRGINHHAIFFEERNYYYFLQLLKKNLLDYVDVLAYCLLPNHFHLIIKAKEETEAPVNKDPIPSSDRLLEKDIIGKLISDQFRKMFISYTQAINKQENRDGALMLSKFKRVEITQHEYLEYAIFYTLYNPEKHGIVKRLQIQFVQSIGMSCENEYKPIISFRNLWRQTKFYKLP